MNIKISHLWQATYHDILPVYNFTLFSVEVGRDDYYPFHLQIIVLNFMFTVNNEK